jgi:2-desacetyl-2-hydroxyethyl bacteriochlorophyllide A dehydrogenase
MPICRTVYFTAPRQVELREQSLPPPAADEVLVESLVSAISCGTEMLVYRGQFPRDLSDSHDPLSSGLKYPTQYGYACIGHVVAVGKSVDRGWENRRVFSFQPHASHFLARPDALIPIPDSLSPETAAFLPSMETAVNLVQDAAPILGERLLVLGQGVIGLLTAALLREFPLECLVTADCYTNRRAASLEAGATASLDPAASDFRLAALDHARPAGYDLTIEVSGSPSALDDAIALTAFSGRIVIGSWYGEKQAPVDLGSKFHRSRLRLISSQVSTIAPELSGRWDKARRFGVAWNALERIRPEKWITHRFPIENAREAYQLLDESAGQAIQVLMTYAP